MIKFVFSLANYFRSDVDDYVNPIHSTKSDLCEIEEYVIDANGRVVDKL